MKRIWQNIGKIEEVAMNFQFDSRVVASQVAKIFENQRLSQSISWLFIKKFKYLSI